MRKKQASKSTIIRGAQSVQKEAIKRGPVVTFVAAFLLFALLGFLFHYFVMGDFYFKNDELRAKVEKKEQENNRGRLVEESLPAFQEEFRKLINLSEEIKPMLPEETEVSEILAGVQEMARRHNVELTGLNAAKDSGPSPGADKLFERELPAQVVGTTSSVTQFFYELARLPRIVVVRDFEFIAGRGNTSTANFTLVCFHAPPPNAPNKMPPLPDFIQRDRKTVAQNTEFSQGVKTNE
jgi:Tfp pilus assembly protein PilO